MSTTDRIEKKVLLHAPKSRVWRALINAEEFGAWFEVKLAVQGDFTPGACIRGRFADEPEDTVMTIDRVEPEDLFSYRWVPYSVDPGVDIEKEPTTLVEFRLSENGEGTLLTVTESGFDAVSPDRRARAYQMNDAGWTQQLENIARYIES